MDHHKLVQPENMNSQGSLFGGYLLKWLDEFAFITACLDYPGRRFVTIALDDVEFRHQIRCGQILRFSVNQKRIGTTSVEYFVEVFGSDESSQAEKVLFATSITFVNITEEGAKAPIRP